MSAPEQPPQQAPAMSGDAVYVNPGATDQPQPQPAPAAPADTVGGESATGVAAAPVPASEATAQPTHLEAPVPERPNLPPCPRCNIGLLYPITWDTEATHEDRNPIFAPKQASGGSVFRHCFHCDYGDSVALNPSDAPPDPRVW